MQPSRTSLAAVRLALALAAGTTASFAAADGSGGTSQPAAQDSPGGRRRSDLAGRLR
ncbi:hypothetical protein [Streptomyces sp. NPDC006668]|uniref:hypothetical protein n=1 Tax=Streptomyces sp. NPDC006668 TaxID=3156903 RepID=UPI0033D293B1